MVSAHGWTAATAAFFASLVEFVEALTVIIAVGAIRGWRSALAGAAAALLVLIAMVAVLGPALTRIPLAGVQLVVGALLILFGMRWLRKAVLRAAGVIALHDEAAAFDRQTREMREHAGISDGWDAIALAASFKITVLEGMEVVFIVIAVGAGGAGLLPAAFGALAALAVVIAAGVAIHRPLAMVPENALKFVVGVLLSSFGAFWFGEGLGMAWPAGDAALVPLSFGFLAVALVTVVIARRATPPHGAATQGGSA